MATLAMANNSNGFLPGEYTLLATRATSVRDAKQAEGGGTGPCEVFLTRLPSGACRLVAWGADGRHCLNVALDPRIVFEVVTASNALRFGAWDCVPPHGVLRERAVELLCSDAGGAATLQQACGPAQEDTANAYEDARQAQMPEQPQGPAQAAAAGGGETSSGGLVFAAGLSKVYETHHRRMYCRGCKALNCRLTTGPADGWFHVVGRAMPGTTGVTGAAAVAAASLGAALGTAGTGTAWTGTAGTGAAGAGTAGTGTAGAAAAGGAAHRICGHVYCAATFSLSATANSGPGARHENYVCAPTGGPHPYSGCCQCDAKGRSAAAAAVFTTATGKSRDAGLGCMRVERCCMGDKSVAKRA